MLGVERLGGAVVWCFFVAITWVQAQFIHPLAEWWLESVLGTWEESLKSVIRELFAQVIRIVNYVLNALFSWFPGYQSVKTTFQKPSAWQSWWDENRQSTFNAIIDRDKSMRGGAEGLNLHTTEAPKSSKSMLRLISDTHALPKSPNSTSQAFVPICTIVHMLYKSYMVSVSCCYRSRRICRNSASTVCAKAGSSLPVWLGLIQSSSSRYGF